MNPIRFWTKSEIASIKEYIKEAFLDSIAWSGRLDGDECDDRREQLKHQLKEIAAFIGDAESVLLNREKVNVTRGPGRPRKQEQR